MSNFVFFGLILTVKFDVFVFLIDEFSAPLASFLLCQLFQFIVLLLYHLLVRLRLALQMSDHSFHISDFLAD